MRPTALGCYIFAGGFTLGVKKHFDVLAHLEGDKYGVATSRKNFPDLPIYYGPEKWPLRDFHGVDLIYGNPPCAAWSVAGYTKTRGTDKWRTDPRVECTVKHFGLIEALRPKVWVWESVIQAYTKGAEFVRKLEEDALRQGYAVTYLLHNAQWLGLPQIRKRFFMIAHKVDLPIPAPNWAPGPTPLEVLETVPTSMRSGPDRIENDWSMKSFPEKVLRKIPPGTRLSKWWEDHHPESTWKRRPDGCVIGRPSYGHYRLHPTTSCGAVVGYGMVHPVEHRFLNTKEYQALSGFPLDYEFTPGGGSARASEIARGLCPPVAEWLARHVAAALRREAPLRHVLTQIDYRSPPEAGENQVVLLDPGRPREFLVDAAPRSPARIRKVSSNHEPVPLARPKNPPVPRQETRSGQYIRFLLQLERYTTGEIVELVHRFYKESKATGADVSWHRDDMKSKGHPVRVVRELSDGTRKFMERRAR